MSRDGLFNSFRSTLLIGIMIGLAGATEAADPPAAPVAAPTPVAVAAVVPVKIDDSTFRCMRN